MKLDAYQEKGVTEITKFKGRCLLALDMGLGKTLITCEWLRQNPDALPAVVVCPASVKSNWEWHINEVLRSGVDIADGKTPPSGQRMRDRQSILVVNYDILSEWEEHITKQLQPKTLVLDESQYCANRGSNRTKSCLRLSRQTTNLIASSGTPLLNRPVELWPTLNMLRPDLYGSFWSFGQRFCEPRMTPWGWQYKGATNTRTLRRELRRNLMYRVTKTDVLKTLPKKTRHVHILEIDRKDEYEFAERDFVRWLQRKRPELRRRKKQVQAIRLQRAGALKQLAVKLKARRTVRWINQWLEDNPEKKLIVFAWHIKMVDVLERRCQSKSVVIKGGVSSKKRKQAVQAFRTDDSIRLCIGNIRAMGTGLDGLQIASDVVFTELDWSPAVHEQAEDRSHRRGQQSAVHVHYLVAGGTIEEKLCGLLQDKKSVVSQVLDGEVATEDNLNLFDKVMEQLE